MLSLTLRQTNILWIAFIAFAALTTAVEPTTGASRRNKVKVSQKKQERNGSPHPPSEEVGFLRSLIGDTRFTVASIMGQPLAAIRIVGPYIPVAVVFVAFLLWNGGIVLGDKSMHVAVLHIPQLYYFIAFTAIFVSPHILNRTIVAKTLVSFFGSTMYVTRNALTLFSSDVFQTSQSHDSVDSNMCSNCLDHISLYVRVSRTRTVSQLLTCFFACTVDRFEHPFLLADNRHYTFYIWKRLVNFSSHGRYMLAPAYLACFAALYQCTCRFLLNPDRSYFAT